MATLDRRAVLAGLVATLTMTGFMAAIPSIGFPRVDVAALLTQPVLGRQAAPFSPWWWLGMAVHFALGTFLFPAALRTAQARYPASHPVAVGLVVGAALFLIGEGVLIPISGGGFFSSHANQPALTVVEDFLSHSLYGLILGALADRT